MRKPRFSIRQHVQTGQSLKDMIRCADRIAEEMVAAYPIKTKAVRRMIKASAMLSLARNELYEQMFLENYGSLTQWPINNERVYYGPVEDDLTDEEAKEMGNWNAN